MSLEFTVIPVPAPISTVAEDPRAIDPPPVSPAPAVTVNEEFTNIALVIPPVFTNNWFEPLTPIDESSYTVFTVTSRVPLTEIPDPAIIDLRSPPTSTQVVPSQK